MQETIYPASALQGAVTLPGDKSISHRYGMLTAIAGGVSKIHNYSQGADCQSTLDCMQALGVQIERSPECTVVNGVGLDGLKAPATRLDAGNSGSTIRMLSGILAAQPFTSEIEGDESLARRPMARIMKPLSEMGASISARNGQFPPLHIVGSPLRPVDYTLEVASAQVKSCLLFAGLFADGTTTVREPVRTRDHSEIALRELGADVETEKRVIRIHGRPRLEARELVVPGDLSAAAFFLVAALIVPGSHIVIRGVGLNPTRSRLLDFLAGMGARVEIPELKQVCGELMGDIVVRHGAVGGGTLEGDLTASLIDEIPVLSILGAVSEEGLTVRDASELRVKETDRIQTVAENLSRMGVKLETAPDGFRVPGRQKFHAAALDSFGDHRIAMAFAVAALAADGPCVIDGAESASVSFPDFWSKLRSLPA